MVRKPTIESPERASPERNLSRQDGELGGDLGPRTPIREKQPALDVESDGEEKDDALFYRKRFREFSASGPCPVSVGFDQE